VRRGTGLRFETSQDLLVALNTRWSVAEDAQGIALFDPAGRRLSRPEFAEWRDLIRVVSDSRISVADLARVLNVTGEREIEDLCACLSFLEDRGVVHLVHPTPPHAEGEKDSARFRWQLTYFERYEAENLDRFSMLSRIRNARFCVIGIGGLGALVAQILCASGARHLTIVDGDTVSLDNLPRQFLFKESEIGQSKVGCLARTLKQFDSEVSVTCREDYVRDESQAIALTRECNFIILCADQPRLLIHKWIGEASIHHRIPYIAMAGSWVGPIGVPFVSPCYVCQARYNRLRMADYPGYLRAVAAAPLPARPGYGPGVAFNAAMIANAVIEYVAGIETELSPYRRFRCDLWGHFSSEELVRYRDCPRCGSGNGDAAAPSPRAE